MISKQQFLDSVLKEIRIVKHLYGKLPPDGLNYRPTEKQRSTLELLQYLAHFAEVETLAIHRGKMENFHEAIKTAYQMPAENFLQRMDEQALAIEKIFGKFTETEHAEEIDLFGRGLKQSKSLWLLELVLKNLVGYKMQLFLYIKACGVSDIGTSNLWRGEDAKKLS